MKFYQFRPDKGSINQILARELKGLCKYEKDFFGENFVYVADQRIDNSRFELNRKANVTILFSEKLFPTHFKISKGHIAYEDTELVVFNKPVGLPSQPTLKKGEDHLYGAAISHYTKTHPGRLAYIGLHHRLDRMTSGLILMTKKSSMNKPIADQFQERKVKKRYLALVTGPKSPPKKWSVNAPIGRLYNKNGQFKFAVNVKKSDEALTHFNLLKEVQPNQFLLECIPITGRTHQIRVHLAHSQFPIVGDVIYGGTPSNRLCLHAAEITFTHPKTNKPLTIENYIDF